MLAYTSVEKILTRLGYSHTRTRGSHHQFTHPHRATQPVPVHNHKVRPDVFRLILRNIERVREREEQETGFVHDPVQLVEEVDIKNDDAEELQVDLCEEVEVDESTSTRTSAASNIAPHEVDTSSSSSGSASAHADLVPVTTTSRSSFPGDKAKAGGSTGITSSDEVALQKGTRVAASSTRRSLLFKPKPRQRSIKLNVHTIASIVLATEEKEEYERLLQVWEARAKAKQEGVRQELLDIEAEFHELISDGKAKEAADMLENVVRDKRFAKYRGQQLQEQKSSGSSSCQQQSTSSGGDGVDRMKILQPEATVTIFDLELYYTTALEQHASSFPFGSEKALAVYQKLLNYLEKMKTVWWRHKETSVVELRHSECLKSVLCGLSAALCKLREKKLAGLEMVLAQRNVTNFFIWLVGYFDEQKLRAEPRRRRFAELTEIFGPELLGLARQLLSPASHFFLEVAAPSGILQRCEKKWLRELQKAPKSVTLLLEVFELIVPKNAKECPKARKAFWKRITDEINSRGMGLGLMCGCGCNSGVRVSQERELLKPNRAEAAYNTELKMLRWLREFVGSFHDVQANEKIDDMTLLHGWGSTCGLGAEVVLSLVMLNRLRPSVPARLLANHLALLRKFNLARLHPAWVLGCDFWACSNHFEWSAYYQLAAGLMTFLYELIGTKCGRQLLLQNKAPEIFRFLASTNRSFGAGSKNFLWAGSSTRTSSATARHSSTAAAAAGNKNDIAKNDIKKITTHSTRSWPLEKIPVDEVRKVFTETFFYMAQGYQYEFGRQSGKHVLFERSMQIPEAAPHYVLHTFFLPVQVLYLIEQLEGTLSSSMTRTAASGRPEKYHHAGEDVETGNKGRDVPVDVDEHDGATDDHDRTSAVDPASAAATSASKMLLPAAGRAVDVLAGGTTTSTTSPTTSSQTTTETTGRGEVQSLKTAGTTSMKTSREQDHAEAVKRTTNTVVLSTEDEQSPNRPLARRLVRFLLGWMQAGLENSTVDGITWHAFVRQKLDQVSCAKDPMTKKLMYGPGPVAFNCYPALNFQPRKTDAPLLARDVRGGLAPLVCALGQSGLEMWDVVTREEANRRRLSGETWSVSGAEFVEKFLLQGLRDYDLNYRDVVQDQTLFSPKHETLTLLLRIASQCILRTHEGGGPGRGPPETSRPSSKPQEDEVEQLRGQEDEAVLEPKGTSTSKDSFNIKQTTASNSGGGGVVRPRARKAISFPSADTAVTSKAEQEGFFAFLASDYVKTVFTVDYFTAFLTEQVLFGPEAMNQLERMHGVPDPYAAESYSSADEEEEESTSCVDDHGDDGEGGDDDVRTKKINSSDCSDASRVDKKQVEEVTNDQQDDSTTSTTTHKEQSAGEQDTVVSSSANERTKKKLRRKPDFYPSRGPRDEKVDAWDYGEPPTIWRFLTMALGVQVLYERVWEAWEAAFPFIRDDDAGVLVFGKISSAGKKTQQNKTKRSRRKKNACTSKVETAPVAGAPAPDSSERRRDAGQTALPEANNYSNSAATDSQSSSSPAEDISCTMEQRNDNDRSGTGENELDPFLENTNAVLYRIATDLDIDLSFELNLDRYYCNC
ncbi:unnamed protein product [Amoebophrya sp. A120]|nr:unnamed protein product [Amoebophrya sp. A120]|eukprot:GSA120T00023790001.1